MTAMCRGLSLGLTLLAATALFPGAAAGHATMLESVPPMQARLDRPPARIVLRFDQAVAALAALVTVGQRLWIIRRQIRPPA